VQKGESKSPPSGGYEFDLTSIDALILKKLTGSENTPLGGKGELLKRCLDDDLSGKKGFPLPCRSWGRKISSGKIFTGGNRRRCG